MAAGRLGRLRARLAGLALFPLRAAFVALRSDWSCLVPTTNPFFLPLVLVSTRNLHGKPVIPLVYDLYPDTLEAAGAVRRGGAFSRLASAANRYWLARADAVVFLGEGMASHVLARYGEPNKWAVIETGADLSEFEQEQARCAEPPSELDGWCEGKNVISYVGNLGWVHDWSTLANGVPILVDQGTVGTAVGVVVAASGPGVEYLMARWRRLPSETVRFEPPLADSQWARLLLRSAISVVVLKSEASKVSIPSKVYSAMAAGSAIIAVAPTDSDLAALVRRHSCGEVVEPCDASGFVAAVQRLANDPMTLALYRSRAREAVKRGYDTPILVGKWLDLISSLPRRKLLPLPYRVAKRLIDLLAALVGLVLSLPIVAAVALAIRAFVGSPVFFRQGRPGLQGRPFRLVKFRTMTEDRGVGGATVSDAHRLTRLGRFLRSTSLDELPTLWNIIRGDMTLVGPRPLLMAYVDRYTPEQARRHEVKPGITGWAQVKGRNALTWEDKFKLDVWYVEHMSFWLDIKILWMTLLKVLRREGISASGCATMPEFMGSAGAATAKAPE